SRDGVSSAVSGGPADAVEQRIRVPLQEISQRSQGPYALTELEHRLAKLLAERGILPERAPDAPQGYLGALPRAPERVRRVLHLREKRIGVCVDLRHDAAGFLHERGRLGERRLSGLEGGLGLGRERADLSIQVPGEGVHIPDQPAGIDERRIKAL